MICYSGHDKQDHLTLSDYMKNKSSQDKAVSSREKLEQYFNGNNMDDKAKIIEHKFSSSTHVVEITMLFYITLKINKLLKKEMMIIIKWDISILK